MNADPVMSVLFVALLTFGLLLLHQEPQTDTAMAIVLCVFGGLGLVIVHFVRR